LGAAHVLEIAINFKWGRGDGDYGHLMPHPKIIILKTSIFRRGELSPLDPP